MDHCVQSSDLEGAATCGFSVKNAILKSIGIFSFFFK